MEYTHGRVGAVILRLKLHRRNIAERFQHALGIESRDPFQRRHLDVLADATSACLSSSSFTSFISCCDDRLNPPQTRSRPTQGTPRQWIGGAFYLFGQLKDLLKCLLRADPKPDDLGIGYHSDSSVAPIQANRIKIVAIL